MSQMPRQGVVSVADLDLESSTPLYRQLASSLRDGIESGALRPGDPLPTEQSLSHDLGLGVSTVRSAYALLVKEGLVARRRGRGTFVAKARLDRRLTSLYNFSAEIRASGRVPSSKVLAFEVVEAGREAAGALGLEGADKVYRIRRLRLADQIPLLIETSYVPTSICPGLREESLTGSLYEEMERCMGAHLVRAVEKHDAVSLDDRDARDLGRPAGAAALRITRLTFNSRGEACEYGINVAPESQVSYTMELGLDGTAVSKNFSVSGAAGAAVPEGIAQGGRRGLPL